MLATEVLAPPVLATEVPVSLAVVGRRGEYGLDAVLLGSVGGDWFPSTCRRHHCWAVKTVKSCCRTGSLMVFARTAFAASNLFRAAA